MREHGRPFVCEICHKICKKKDNLLDHEWRKHAVNTPWVCNFEGCMRKGRGLATRSLLECHLDDHGIIHSQNNKIYSDRLLDDFAALHKQMTELKHAGDREWFKNLRPEYMAKVAELSGPGHESDEMIWEGGFGEMQLDVRITEPPSASGLVTSLPQDLITAVWKLIIHRVVAFEPPSHDSNTGHVYDAGAFQALSSAWLAHPFVSWRRKPWSHRLHSYLAQRVVGCCLPIDSVESPSTEHVVTG